MKKLTRRDFLVGLRNLGIGVGILPLVEKFPWKDPEPEILEEATEQLLFSGGGMASAISIAWNLPEDLREPLQMCYACVHCGTVYDVFTSKCENCGGSEMQVV